MGNNVLKTGYRRLDDKEYGGIKRGELTMLYSRHGMGKSAFLSNVFLNMVSQIPQMKCMFFVFEEPEKYAYEKMVCIKSGVPYWKYFNGEYFSEKEKRKIKQTEDWLGEKIHVKTSTSRIIDKAHSLAELLIFVAEAKASYGLDAVFIDNLYYLKDFANEEINHVVYNLKELAVRLDIAVLATACLMSKKMDFPPTRRIKNKFILRTADKVIILNRSEELATDLHIIKNYTGDYGIVSLRFDSETMRFYDPQFDNLEEPPYDESEEM